MVWKILYIFLTGILYGLAIKYTCFTLKMDLEIHNHLVGLNQPQMSTVQ